MMKIETIWHEILFSALTEKKFKHTQQDLAAKFGYSLSTISHALEVPSQIGALRKASKFFVLEDFSKLLYYWASRRRLERDVVYATHLEESMGEIESLVPAGSILAGYSAAKKILVEPPADYSKVYVYLPKDLLMEAERRFPKGASKKFEPNLYVLSQTAVMLSYGKVTTLPQTFVDVWSLRDWYAREFTKALEEKMYGILS